MIFHVLTIFPEFFEGPFAHGVVKRAKDAGLLDIRIHDLRDWTHDRHKTVDDRPFGGGEGMVLKPRADLRGRGIDLAGAAARTQKWCCFRRRAGCSTRRWRERLSRSAELLLICGRYEGVDERVAEHLADEELSIGDYVLSGGELAAAVVIDTVARLLPGRAGQRSLGGVRVVLRRPGTATGLLDCPHWTRPADFRGWKAAGGAAGRQSRGDPEIPARRRRWKRPGN